MSQPSKLNLIWLLPWMLITWAAVELLVWLPLFVLGLAAVPLMLRAGLITERESWLNQGQQVIAFRWSWADELWGNHEDGLCPAWWAQKGGTAWTWYLRNSISNMRFWPVLSTRANRNTHFRGSTEIAPGCRFVAWTGPYVGLRWEGARWGIWLGWAVNPRDASEVLTSDWRAHGYSVVAQVFRTGL